MRIQVMPAICLREGCAICLRDIYDICRRDVCGTEIATGLRDMCGTEIAIGLRDICGTEKAICLRERSATPGTDSGRKVRQKGARRPCVFSGTDFG